MVLANAVQTRHENVRWLLAFANLGRQTLPLFASGPPAGGVRVLRLFTVPRGGLVAPCLAYPKEKGVPPPLVGAPGGGAGGDQAQAGQPGVPIPTLAPLSLGDRSEEQSFGDRLQAVGETRSFHCRFFRGASRVVIAAARPLAAHQLPRLAMATASRRVSATSGSSPTRATMNPEPNGRIL